LLLVLLELFVEPDPAVVVVVSCGGFETCSGTSKTTRSGTGRKESSKEKARSGGIFESSVHSSSQVC
jgi:hypothetical protein